MNKINYEALIGDRMRITGIFILSSINLLTNAFLAIKIQLKLPIKSKAGKNFFFIYESDYLLINSWNLSNEVFLNYL